MAKRFCLQCMLLLMLFAALQCAAETGSCRHGDVCACETCTTDPVLGRWAGDLPEFLLVIHNNQ